MPVDSITKKLSRTDAGESSTHQSGILIPVAEGRRIFPDPFGEAAGEWFDCRDHTGRDWQFKFRHRVKESESRITYITQYIKEYQIRSGDSITICEPEGGGQPYTISFLPSSVLPWREGEEVLEAREELEVREEPGLREEGAAVRVLVNRYERDPRNRESAIQRHGVRCFGCCIEMAEVYGQMADGFIHIHHVKPVHTVQGARPDIEDLVPLCPNCHAIVHLEVPPVTIDRLREMIRQQRD